ncbi:5-deoxy-glucuronate isomerase [Serratia ureilytica]
MHNISCRTASRPTACWWWEAYTDEGNTSSYPSHKHDREDSPDETYLEETYYHRIQPEQGFPWHAARLYDDRTLDECMPAHNRDVVKVPRGYHPVATAGYDNYYLNVMAGPVRQWKFTRKKTTLD